MTPGVVTVGVSMNVEGNVGLGTTWVGGFVKNSSRSAGNGTGNACPAISQKQDGVSGGSVN